MIHVTPYGAVKGVTGSCFLIDDGESKILVDCGLFQGDEETKNERTFPFVPAEIDVLILTHAHLDHSGRVPLLVKNGFRGKVVCTKGTRDIVRIMLLDAAKVMQEDHLVKQRKAERRGESAQSPLYSQEDVVRIDGQYHVKQYGERFRVSSRTSVVLRDAGHILGSAFLEIHSGDCTIVFSGDLGNYDKPIVRDPVVPDAAADTIFVESTYGDRQHRVFEESMREFEEAIQYAFSRGGNVIIPSFALERAQELLYILRDMYDTQRLPACRVFLDSPLAIAATALFRENPEYFDEEARKIYDAGRDPFYFPYLIYSRTVEQSKSINGYRDRSIIIVGSGMCNGGRILHHLKHNLWNENNSVVFVGYQSRGTIGRKIIDGEKLVRIYGETVKVNAKVFTINGFSSHADVNILKKWLHAAKNLKNIYLIHGEPDIMTRFKAELEREFTAAVTIPGSDEAISV